MNPPLLVIAGPNGSGKTTIYGELPAWMAGAAASLPRHPDFADLRAV